jgi:hypothetical protein
MRNVFLALIATTCAMSPLLAQAPPGWTRLSDGKDVATKAAKARELGVWKNPDSELRVQLIQLDPINTAQGVWNFVGGALSGLTKGGQQPTSHELLKTGRHVAFHFHGNGIQEGTSYSFDTYAIFAQSHSYLLKAFIAHKAETGFIVTEWDFGEPLTTERAECEHALEQIKARLDAQQTLDVPTPTPSRLTASEEEFESAKNATDAELRSDLRIWTRIIDTERKRAANHFKKSGERVDLDARLKPYLRRWANNRFFDIDREHAFHPGYSHELSMIAALRGQTFRGEDPVYQVVYSIGRYGIPIAFIVFIVSRWTRRISRKNPPRPGVARSAYYAKLLLKMSWRVALLVVLANVIALAIHLRNIYSDDELARAAEMTALLTFVVLPVAALITIWSQAKRRFIEAASAPHLPAASI